MLQYMAAGQAPRQQPRCAGFSLAQDFEAISRAPGDCHLQASSRPFYLELHTTI